MTERKAKRVMWGAIALHFVLVLCLQGAGVAHAQGRSVVGGGSYVTDAMSIASSVPAIMRMLAILFAFATMAYYTWKLKPKDPYEAAYQAFGWVAVAWILFGR